MLSQVDREAETSDCECDSGCVKEKERITACSVAVERASSGLGTPELVKARRTSLRKSIRKPMTIATWQPRASHCRVKSAAG